MEPRNIELDSENPNFWEEQLDTTEEDVEALVEVIKNYIYHEAQNKIKQSHPADWKKFTEFCRNHKSYQDNAYREPELSGLLDLDDPELSGAGFDKELEWDLIDALKGILLADKTKFVKDIWVATITSAKCKDFGFRSIMNQTVKILVELFEREHTLYTQDTGLHNNR